MIVSRKFPLLLASLLTVCSSLAAQPTIGNIRYTALTHASLRWLYTVNPVNSYVQIKYGTVPGVYPYNTSSYRVNEPAGKVSFAIGALAPSTTYFFRMTARPNPDDDTGICQTDSCGAVEQSVTTPAEPPLHPELPISPAVYNPPHPDTSNYVVVPMAPGAGGECVATSSIAAANVIAGHNVGTVLNEIGYGTVLEFPQGATCNVPPQDAQNTGYRLPNKPLDPNAGGDINSPNHRWIVLRTASASETDFPPFGSRISPAWAGKLAKLVAQKQSFNNGQIFDTGGLAPHHFWFENLEFTYTTSTTAFPPEAADPRPFLELIKITAQYGLETPPQQIVLDRLYIHGNGFPGRILFGISLGGINQAMIGCSLVNLDYWRMAGFPTQNPVVSSDGATLSLPAQGYKFNVNDSPRGMTAPATVTLSGDPGYTGTFLGYLSPDGLTLLYSPGAATLSCTNCTATQTAAQTPPFNGYNWFSGNISNGKISVGNTNTAEWQTTHWSGWGTFGLQLLDGGRGPYLFENNTLDGYGLGFYIDAGGSIYSNDDVTWTHNHSIWNQDHRPNSSTWNGYRYDVRQLWEMKRGKRYLLKGNIFQGNWAFQNPGPAILLSGRSNYTLDNLVTGISDITMTGNIIRHTSYGWSCGGASDPSPDPQVTTRVLFTNNLLYDLNRYVYDDHGPAFSSGYMDSFPGCQDVTIRHNTMGLALGRGPYLMLIGGDGVLGEGLSVTDNIMYLSAGEGGMGIGVDDNPGMASHPRYPGVNSNLTFKQKLDAFFVRTGSAIVPNYRWTNNVIIGGKTGTSATDLRSFTGAEVNALAAQFPAGNFFPAGETVQEREGNVNFLDVAHWKFRLTSASPYLSGDNLAASTGGTIGANQEELDSAIGLVKDIAVAQISDAQAQIGYTAPDGKSCSVDFTGDNGASWSRVNDGGGDRARQVVLDSLTAATTYQYRVLCYYEQANDGVIWTEYSPDQITSGTFQTLPAGSGSAQSQRFTFSPPAGLSAAQARLEYGATRALGTLSSLTPCATGCSIAVSWPGSRPLYHRWVYLDAGGRVLQRSSISVRLAR